MSATAKAVRAYVVQAIKDASTAAGSRVFSEYPYPLSVFPSVVVEAFSARYALVSASPGLHEVTLDLMVECFAKQVTGYAEVLDDMSTLVYSALMSEPTLGGLVDDTRIVRRIGERSADSEQPVMVAALNFEVLYLESSDIDPATLDELRSTYVDYHLAPDDGQRDAEDQITGLYD